MDLTTKRTRGVQDEQCEQGARHLGSKMCRPLPVQASAVEARQHLQIIFFFGQICFKNCSRLRFLIWIKDKLMNIKITLNEISVGGLLLTLSHEIYSRMGVLNTECDLFSFETKMPFEWLNTHLVLPSCWQS